MLTVGVMAEQKGEDHRNSKTSNGPVEPLKRVAEASGRGRTLELNFKTGFDTRREVVHLSGAIGKHLLPGTEPAERRWSVRLQTSFSHN